MKNVRFFLKSAKTEKFRKNFVILTDFKHFSEKNVHWSRLQEKNAINKFVNFS